MNNYRDPQVPDNTSRSDSFACGHQLQAGSSWRSDISFFVEEEAVSIPAHTLIVAAASRMLEACCFGSGNCVQPVADRIRVPNCSEAEFRVVLRYIYASVYPYQLKDIKRSDLIKEITFQFELTAANTAKVLFLADYFGLEQLKEDSSRLLRSKLNHQNICAIYATIHMLDDPLVEYALRLILLNGSAMLAKGHVMRMNCEAAFAKVLRSHNLNVRRVKELFDAMCDWAEAEVTAEGLANNGSPEWRRKLSGNRLQFVRFDWMTAIEFADCIQRAGPGFFTFFEVGYVMHRIVLGDKCAALSLFETAKNEQEKGTENGLGSGKMEKNK